MQGLSGNSSGTWQSSNLNLNKILNVKLKVVLGVELENAKTQKKEPGEGAYS